MDVLGIALSGMQSAHTRLAASAHNVANGLTADFRPLRTRQVTLDRGGSRALVEQAPDPAPVRLEREVVGQLEASVQYTASLRVFEAGAELRGRLVDLLA